VKNIFVFIFLSIAIDSVYVVLTILFHLVYTSILSHISFLEYFKYEVIDFTMMLYDLIFFIIVNTPIITLLLFIKNTKIKTMYYKVFMLVKYLIVTIVLIIFNDGTMEYRKWTFEYFFVYSSLFFYSSVFLIFFVIAFFIEKYTFLKYLKEG
jgi:hypothetical protein